MAKGWRAHAVVGKYEPQANPCSIVGFSAFPPARAAGLHAAEDSADPKALEGLHVPRVPVAANVQPPAATSSCCSFTPANRQVSDVGC